MKGIDDMVMVNELRKLASAAYHSIKEKNIEKRYLQFVEKDMNTMDYSAAALSYCNHMRDDDKLFKFSSTSLLPSIYSVTYGCLLESLYGRGVELEGKRWKAYFDVHQRSSDGLFYDMQYDSDSFLYGTDGWGARHLVPHITIVFDRMGLLPKYEFSYLDKYKNPDTMIEWLDSLDYRKIWGSSNAIMNYGVAMQYARDRMDGDYALAVEAMEEYLIKKVNRYGMWFEGEITSPEERNEMIRGAYHILPILYYDGIDIPNCEKAVDEILKAQNKWGGFDVHIASSACEDIDGVDPLMRFSVMAGRSDDEKVVKAINKARTWILFNQNQDGGFVFEKEARFSYGGQSVLSSAAGESNMFATWFRCVSLELINEFLEEKKSLFINTPGYELPLRRG